MAAPKQTSWVRPLGILAVLIPLLSLLYYAAESTLQTGAVYIFDPPSLHNLSLRAISEHGNDTRAVVSYIVSELSEKLPGGYVNLDEEWIFNNAGGAMGAMYIIHASKSVERKRGIHVTDM
jgi:C-8 sterol isomerase